MKNFWTKLIYGKLPVILICTAFISSNMIIAQETSKQTNNSDVKMNSVPQTETTRTRGGSGVANKSEATVSEPRSGVIPKALVRQDSSGRVVRVSGEVEVQEVEDARDAADKFLAENGKKMGIESLTGSKDITTGLRIVKQVKSLTGTHLTYQQFYKNLPVFDEAIKVSVNKKLKVTNVSNDVTPLGKEATRSFQFELTDEDEAIKTALAAVNGTVSASGKPEAKAGIVMSKDGGANKVFRVTFITSDPPGSWVVMVDSRLNEVISKRNNAIYASGRIFSPNPVNSSGDATLRDNDNQNSPLLNLQTRIVSLNDLDNSGTLSGKFATTSATTKFTRARDSEFSYFRSDPRFEEVMSYHWVTEASRYVRSLGFTGVLNEPLKIDVNGTTADNSFYSRGQWQLTFGTGGVDDAEDASIIFHEFGHALLDNQAEGFGFTFEGDAIHEAFGDYLAASYFAEVGNKPAGWEIYVGTWDMAATSGNTNSPGFLRHVGGTKKYPDDFIAENGRHHSNCEIWSATLWDIRKSLGRKMADTLIIESNFKLAKADGFKENALAILATDKELNEGKNTSALQNIFKNRGMIKDEDIAETPSETTGGAPVVLTGQTWNGNDTFNWKYAYAFGEAGQAKVTITVPTGQSYTDANSKYTVSKGVLSVTAFSGLINQIGRVDGDQLNGKTLYSTCVEDETAQKIIADLGEASKAKLNTQLYDWTGGKEVVAVPVPPRADPTTLEGALANNKVWKGADKDWKFEYQFLADGQIKVSFIIPDKEPRPARSASYKTDGNRIEILIDGWITHKGTYDGNKIDGQAIYDFSKAKTSKAQEIRSKLKVNKDEDEIIENWTAVPKQ